MDQGVLRKEIFKKMNKIIIKNLGSAETASQKRN